MALIGTEKNVKCPQCGAIDFEQKTIVRFAENVTPEKMRVAAADGAPIPLKAKKTVYICVNCNTVVK